MLNINHKKELLWSLWVDNASSEEKEAVISKLQMELTLLRATTGSAAAPAPETRKQPALTSRFFFFVRGLGSLVAVSGVLGIREAH